MERVAAMTGLSLEMAAKLCSDKGWTIEADINMVHPVRPPNKLSSHISNEDQLQKLTDFVSYLEN